MQAQTRSQEPSGVDLNNLTDIPTGVPAKQRPEGQGSKPTNVHFVIYIPDGKNTKLQLTPCVDST